MNLMIAKENIRKLEKPLLLGYASLVALVYLLGRNVLEMYTSDIPSPVYWWVGIVLVPFVIYGTLRAAIADGGKWYGFFTYFIGFSAVLLVSGVFLVMKMDLLLSAALKPMAQQQVPIREVEKVFRRKIGFDRTAVTILLSNDSIVMEARPNTYFLLEHKKLMTVTIGKSFLNNYFVTDLHLRPGERWQSRWTYVKDWAHRVWYVPAFFILVALCSVIWRRYVPEKPGIKPKPIGFCRLMGIVMVIVIGLGILLFLGILVYLKFFVHTGTK